LPLAGFKCPTNGEQPGRNNTFDYCLTACSKRCMPKAIMVKLRDQNVHNVHRGNMITPSALKGCTRKLVLERTEDYWERPENLYYAVRGSLIHGFLEEPGLPEVITEARLFKQVKTAQGIVNFSGQIDYYEGAPEFAIEDYKTLSDKGTWFLFNEGAKPEHVLQTNVYRWLCNGGRLGGVDGQVVNWPVERITINYLFMNRVVTTGNTHIERVTSYKSPNNGKRYKLEKKRGIVDKSPRGVPIWEIHIEIPPVPLMSEAEIMEHIGLGADNLDNGFRASEAGKFPPGVLYEKDESWQCGYCAVVERCHDYENTNNTEQFKKYIQLKKVD
jgi:hypothetical protein